MANDNHFRVKNGIKVGDTEVVTSSAKITASIVNVGNTILPDKLDEFDSSISSFNAALGVYTASLSTQTLIEDLRDDASAALAAAQSSREAADAAKSAAESAKNAAIQFRLDADNAASNAVIYQGSACAAKIAASAAQTEAETARDAASAAKSAARASRDSASSALSATLTSESAASDAKAAADIAKADAESAKTAANTFKNDALDAKSDALAAKSLTITAKNDAISSQLAASAAMASSISSNSTASETLTAILGSKATASAAAATAVTERDKTVSARLAASAALSATVVSEASASSSLADILVSEASASSAAATAIEERDKAVSARLAASSALSATQASEASASDSLTEILASEATASGAAATASEARDRAVSSRTAADLALSATLVSEASASSSLDSILSSETTASSASATAQDAKDRAVSSRTAADLALSATQASEASASDSLTNTLASESTASSAAATAVLEKDAAVQARTTASAALSAILVSEASASSSLADILTSESTASSAAATAVLEKDATVQSRLSASSALSATLASEASASSSLSEVLASKSTASSAAATASEAKDRAVSARLATDLALSATLVSEASASSSLSSTILSEASASDAKAAAITAKDEAVQAKLSASGALSAALVSEASASSSLADILVSEASASSAAATAIEERDKAVSARLAASSALSSTQASEASASDSLTNTLASEASASTSAASALSQKDAAVSSRLATDLALSAALVSEASASSSLANILISESTASSAAATAVEEKNSAVQSRLSASSSLSATLVSEASASSSLQDILVSEASASSAAASSVISQNRAISARLAAENSASDAKASEASASTSLASILNAEASASTARAAAVESQAFALSAKNAADNSADAAFLSQQSASVAAAGISALSSQVQDVRLLEARVTTGLNGHYVNGSWYLNDIGSGTGSAAAKVVSLETGGIIYIEKIGVSTSTVIENPTKDTIYSIPNESGLSGVGPYRIYATVPIVVKSFRGSMAIPEAFSGRYLASHNNRDFPIVSTLFSPFSKAQVNVYAKSTSAQNTAVGSFDEHTSMRAGTFTIDKGSYYSWSSGLLASIADVDVPNDDNDSLAVVFASDADILGISHADETTAGIDYKPLNVMSNTEVLSAFSGDSFTWPRIYTGGGLNPFAVVVALLQYDTTLSASSATLKALFDSTNPDTGNKYGDITGNGSISGIGDGGELNGIYLGTSGSSLAATSLFDKLITDYSTYKNETITYLGEKYSIFTGPPTTKNINISGTSKFFTACSANAYFATTGTGDGAGSESEIGLPTAALSDFYVFPDAKISNFKIVSNQANHVTVTNNAGTKLFTADHRGATKTNVLEYLQGDLDGSGSDLGSGNGPYTFAGTAPFYLVCQSSDDAKEMTMFGARRGILTGEQSVTAVATQVTSVKSVVDSHSTEIVTQQSAIDGVEAQYTVKVNSNGFVNGFGFASTTASSEASSAFIIQADRFALVDPTAYNEELTLNPDAAHVPFEIVGGQTKIKNANVGALTAGNIAGNAITGAKISSTTTILAGTQVGLDGTAGSASSVRIFAGDTLANKDQADFRVTQEGELTATRANIQGVITASAIVASNRHQVQELTASNVAQYSVSTKNLANDTIKFIEDEAILATGGTLGSASSKTSVLIGDSNFPNASNPAELVRVSSYSHSAVSDIKIYIQPSAFIFSSGFHEGDAGLKLKVKLYRSSAGANIWTQIESEKTFTATRVYQPQNPSASRFHYYFSEVEEVNIAGLASGTYDFKLDITQTPTFLTNSEIVIGSATVKLHVQEPGSQGGIDGLVDVSSSSPIEGGLLRYSTVRNRWENFPNLSVADGGGLVLYTNSGRNINLYQQTGIVRAERIDLNTAIATSISASAVAVTSLSASTATANTYNFGDGTSQTTAAVESPAYWNRSIYAQGDFGTDPNTVSSFYVTLDATPSKDYGQDSFYSRGSIANGSNQMQVTDSTVVLYTMWVYNKSNSNVSRTMKVFRIDDEARLFINSHTTATQTRTGTFAAAANTSAGPAPLDWDFTLVPGYNKVQVLIYDHGSDHFFEANCPLIGGDIRFVPETEKGPRDAPP